MRKLFPKKANVKRHSENCDSTFEVAIQEQRISAQQQVEGAVQPWPSKVDARSTVWQVGHQRPKVDQPFSESLVGACAGLDPPQLQASTLRCQAYCLNCKTRN